MLRPHLHWPTITGRARSAPGLLLLISLVVGLITALTAAVAPLTERTADRALAADVREAGLRGAVVATIPQEDDYGDRVARDPRSVAKIRQDTKYAQFLLPPALTKVLRPGVTVLTTPALHLLDAGPGRYLRLVYVDTPDGAPAVTYTDGDPPSDSLGADQPATMVPPGVDPWPVQVAVSEAAAGALGLNPGDVIPAEDEQHRAFEVRISGVYAPADRHDVAWQVSTDLLNPTQGMSDGSQRTSAAGLVSPESLPDLRAATPSDNLNQRIIFRPQPSAIRWHQSSAVEQAIVSLEASAGAASSDISWESQLGLVLSDGRAKVASARGQAQVLVIGLLVSALLVLVLAAQLLVRRRALSLSIARERGASLLGIELELFVEALAFAVVGAAVGLVGVGLLVGSAGLIWSVPVLLAATLAAPVMGAAVASRATDARRVPANRGARRTATRARRTRRLALEAVLVATAALSFVALRQRGVVGDDGDGGDLTAASAATLWVVAGSVLVLRVLPWAVRQLLVVARRSTGGVGFLVAARLAQTGAKALPFLVVSTAVAQLTIGVALAATEQQGQSAGALLAVGGDARLTTAPDPGLTDTASKVADQPGVLAAATARVADGVRASSRGSAETVQLVVVDAPAYEKLLASSALPDAPKLSRLSARAADGVPALLLGGDPDLRDGLVVRWEDATIPLEVVGTAPTVNASIDPVVIVDAHAFADQGALANPDTVWAVGPGAAAALRSISPDTGSLVLYADELDARRHAPLASGLVRLAQAASVLLLFFAILGVVLSAAAEAPARSASLGRLRSLGLRDADLRRVLAGELVTPVLMASVTGLALGVGAIYAMFGSMSLERITGQTTTPDVVVPWWIALVVVVLLATALGVAAVEWRRLRRQVLATLLRS